MKTNTPAYSKTLSFSIQYANNKQAFIEHWADIVNMTPEEFEKKFIVNDYDLFDDDEKIGY